jgi:hypothetical protein
MSNPAGNLKSEILPDVVFIVAGYTAVDLASLVINYPIRY